MNTNLTAGISLNDLNEFFSDKKFNELGDRPEFTEKDLEDEECKEGNKEVDDLRRASISLQSSQASTVVLNHAEDSLSTVRSQPAQDGPSDRAQPYIHREKWIEQKEGSVDKLHTSVMKRATELLDKLKKAKQDFWSNCSTRKNKKSDSLNSEDRLHAAGETESVEESKSSNKIGNRELSKKEKKELLPFSPQWITTINDFFSKKDTDLSNDYQIITTPKNDGKTGVCRRDDSHSMNAWESRLVRVNNVNSSNVKSTEEPSNATTVIYASVRCATYSGEQRLIDNMQSVFELQARDANSTIAEALKSGFGSQENPITLKMLSNSLLSPNFFSSGTDFEGTLRSAQLSLIKWANCQKTPFKLTVRIGNETKTVWVKPNILMFNTPVQPRDRQLMSVIGVDDHKSNVEVLRCLKEEFKSHIDAQKQELSNAFGDIYHNTLIRKLDGMGELKNFNDEQNLSIIRKLQEKALDLALKIKVAQELMREISEMEEHPFNFKTGMYGENYGNPHAFNARLKVLYYKMGRISLDNCKTGKDRTEDSVVATDLLAAEIDGNVEAEKDRLFKKFDFNLPKPEETNVEKIDRFTGAIRGIADVNEPAVTQGIVLDKTAKAKESASTLVPRRDFLSAENLKKEIAALNITKDLNDQIIAIIENYSPTKPGQKNLYTTIRDQFKGSNQIPPSLDALLTRFENTAKRRMAFALTLAGATIQMVNNKTDLIWGNKQPRYSDYLFGLSHEEIEAYSQYMAAEVKT